MTRKNLLQLLFLSCLVPTAWAGYGAEDPHLQKLYSTFISPCCWRENLTVHDSEIAQELRGRIRAMVRDGRTDDEIKAVFVKEYTKQILALPEGSAGEWLFLTPWVAAIGGAIGILLLVRRLRAHSAAPAWAGLPPANLDDGWED